MKLRILIAGLILLNVGPAYSAQVLVAIDENSQEMTVSVDGQPQYVWPVSTGVSRYATPTGTYTPFRMEPDHFSKEWDDAPMPHSIFFTPLGHAIHGTEHVANLGRAASHGCVRLAPEDAATLYSLVEEAGMANTKVVINGSADQAMSKVQRHKVEKPPQVLVEDEAQGLAMPPQILIDNSEQGLETPTPLILEKTELRVVENRQPRRVRREADPSFWRESVN